mmetsp:Transcript_30361/g.60543  ORF Transcript_30361/g.60543 Transcript_30361/m.60543 type:complete len:198 (+) Transcript_30361:202-795(+)
MGRKAGTKKRRAGRIGKTKLKNRNYQFYKPPQINDKTVRELWNPRKSPAANMAVLGLQTAVNSSIDARAVIALQSAQEKNPSLATKSNSKKAIELFDIPESDNMNGIMMLPGKTFAQRKLPLSIEDQKYIRRCLARHGDDYHAMMRDIKTNDMQYTESKLKKMAARFFLLTRDQVKVEVPEKIKHLMAYNQSEKMGK